MCVQATIKVASSLRPLKPEKRPRHTCNIQQQKLKHKKGVGWETVALLLRPGGGGQYRLTSQTWFFFPLLFLPKKWRRLSQVSGQSLLTPSNTHVIFEGDKKRRWTPVQLQLVSDWTSARTGVPIPIITQQRRSPTAEERKLFPILFSPNKKQVHKVFSFNSSSDSFRD